MRLWRPLSWSLSVKLPLTMALVIAGVAFTIGAVVLLGERQRLRAELEDKLLAVAAAVSATAGDAVVRHDYWALYKSLKSMTQRHGAASPIRSGVIVSADGRVLAHLDSRRHPPGSHYGDGSLLRAALVEGAPRIGAAVGRNDLIEGAAPIRAGDMAVGAVALWISTAELDARSWSAALTILSLSSALALVGSAVGAVISNRMVQPLRDLARGIDSVGRGEPGSVAPVLPQDRDEIGHLVERFNHMAAQLAEKQRLERQLAVNEKLAALGRVAAGVAHEVNNPLGGMLNCVDTIRRHPDQPELLARYFPLIEKGLNRIHAIVQALLAELKADAGTDAVGGGGRLDDVRELMTAEIGERPITLAWDEDVGDDAAQSCPRVQQIVLNLLKNAVQATPGGGVVRFRACSDGERVTLEVRDDGVGIPPDNLPRIFDPFFTSRPTGTGLGLWITYRLVRSLDGDIVVDSAPGAGAVFSVVIPARPRRAPVSGADVSEAAETKAKAERSAA